MDSKRIVAFAYHDVGFECLSALIERGENIVAVFTHPDSPDEQIWFRSVRDLARERRIPVYTPDSLKDAEWIGRIRELQPDLIFSLYYRNMIPQEILDIPALGAYNMHGSLLPKYRGRVPINWAVLHGEKETGVTLHHMVRRADAGDIVDQERVTIGPQDTAYDVFRKIVPAARRVLERRIASIKKGTAPRIAQDESQAAYFKGRRPEDGKIDWTESAERIYNLIRAVARPYPGAFTHAGGKRLFIWKARFSEGGGGVPGQVLSTKPLIVAAGSGSVEILRLQWDGLEEDDASAGARSLRVGHRLGNHMPVDALQKSDAASARAGLSSTKKILILGVNGFIGNSLTEYILKQRDWEVYGMDMGRDKLDQCMGHERFHFVEGDITINKEWIEYHVRKCDIVIPLVAIATPAAYVTDPLRVFELDFEANLEIVRKCVRYKKRVIFPSTSEVYGMSVDGEFDEETSNLVYGPINKQRWIYSCSKQLLDRVMHAYGLRGELRYTLFRPFNWIGPKLDNILEPKEGSSRVLTQFIGNILRGKDIQLVDGGAQRRSFTYIDDGISALIRIIENRDNAADGRIFNIGNPANDVSIRELAETLLSLIKTYPVYAPLAEKVRLVTVSSGEYYGKGYQDILTRVPSIKNARELLGWEPETGLKIALRKTLDYYLVRPHQELNAA